MTQPKRSGAAVIGRGYPSAPDGTARPSHSGAHTPHQTRMSFVDWTSPREGRLAYTHDGFAEAKVWLLDQWQAWADEQGRARPVDLSGACKYGSLMVQYVFGGSIRGHFEHQYNFIDGRLVDLSHDALDVGRMRHPYQHEPAYFAVPELQASLAGCSPRAEAWGAKFIASRA
jgi:hypothetical protein